MARFCIVAPTQILQQLRTHEALGSHHLLLAHDVVATKEKQQIYHDLFHPSKGTPFREFIILDNSVIELNTPVPDSIIFEAAEIVQPHFVVLPDVPYNTDKTIDSCLTAADRWYHKLPANTNLMVIPQGNGRNSSFRDFVQCAEAFAFDDRITGWGIPRNLVHCPNIATRRDAIKVLAQLAPERSIHLFGFSDNMIDDVICTADPLVYSIDSAVPLRLKYRFYLSNIPSPRRKEWWDSGNIIPDITIPNLLRARHWFSGACHKLYGGEPTYAN